jgi:hypothetical protein
MFKPLIHDAMQLTNRRLFSGTETLIQIFLIVHVSWWFSKWFIISRIKVTLIKTNTL